jgi:CBS domain-containing protein
LKDHHIRAILIEETEGAPHRMLDTDDIVKFLASTWNSLPAGQAQNSEEHKAAIRKAFAAATAGQLAGAVHGSHVRYAPFDTPLDMVMEWMASGESHRVLVEDAQPEGELLDIITPNTMFSYLFTHQDEYGFAKIMARPLSEVHVALEKGVTTVGENDIAISALARMAECRMHNVGIVNNQGVLTGNLSSQDVKVLCEHNMDILFESVLDVSSACRQMSTKDMYPTITCTLSTTVKVVADRLMKAHVHRIYVVDDKKKPIGIYGQRDILKLFLAEV